MHNEQGTTKCLQFLFYFVYLIHYNFKGTTKMSNKEMKYVVLYERIKCSDNITSDGDVMNSLSAVVGHSFDTKKEAINYTESIISNCFNTKPKNCNGIYSVNYNEYIHTFDILKFIDINDIKEINHIKR